MTDLLVDATALASYMKTTFVATDATEATQILTEVQGELETILGKPVTIREFTDTVRVRGAFSYSTRERNVYFPRTPVVSIASVVADGVTQSLTHEQVRPWGIYHYTGTVGDGRTLVVTYTAGLDPADPANAGIKRVIKRAAAREMVKRTDATQGASSVSDEGYRVDYEEPDIGSFTKAEIGGLQRFKRRVMSA